MAFLGVRRAGLACLLAASALSFAHPAVAADDDSSDARAQYGLGQKAFAAKRYSEAATRFETAAALKPSAIALYTAALAWDLASRPERAADAFVRALDVSGLDDAQTAKARDRVAALERTLGSVHVTGPEGTKVQLDTFTEVRTPAKLHASAGAHALNVRVPNRALERREVTLEAGKTTSLELKDEPKPEPKAEEPPRRESESAKTEVLPPRLAHPFWTTPKVIGVGVAGLGLAAIGGAVVLGLNAKDAGSAYRAAPTRATFDHASSLQTWTNVSIVAGAVLVAGGVALVVIPMGADKDSSVQARVTPGGLSVGGKF